MGSFGSHINIRNNSLTFNNKGFELHSMGEYKSAIVQYDLAIKSDPKNVDSYN